MRRVAALSCVLIAAALAGCGGGSSDDHPASTRASATTTPTVGVAAVTTPRVSPGKDGTTTTTTTTGAGRSPAKKKTKPPKLHIKTIVLPKPSPPLKIDLTPSAADRAAIATCEAQVRDDTALDATQRTQLLSICQAVRAKDVADVAKGTPRQICAHLIDSVTLGSAAKKQAAIRKACAELEG